MKYLSIKRFDDLQHYKRKDWSPPWIKLYNRLLDDYDFLQLSEIAQRHLVCLWLLASRCHNRIPNDLAYITTAIKAKSVVDLDSLILAGFLIPTDEEPARKIKRRKKKAHVKPSITVIEEVYTKSTPDKIRVDKSREEKKQPSADRGGWVGRFAVPFSESSGGIAPFGEIGKHCKPLVDRDGEGPTFVRWVNFCASDKRQFGAAYFAKNAGDFDVARKPVLAAKTKEERDREAFLKRGYVLS